MNYYKAIEKKAEHGGGWAFMQLNRREGAAIVCGCGAGGWTDAGHATAEEAERCFYDAQAAKPISWHIYTQASKCVVCDEWTPDYVRSGGHLLTAEEPVCKFHFENADEEARAWLWERHPFAPGIEIQASW